ncbi:MAG: hypothetical protein WCR85_00045 [Sphaerochaeta sp.]
MVPPCTPVFEKQQRPRFVKGKFYTAQTLQIFQEHCPQNPRSEALGAAFGTILCFHKRYNLGDPVDPALPPFESWSKLEKNLRDLCNAEIVLPLYLYDHGVRRMNTTGFACGWDSGQVGFIYITEKEIRDLYGECERTSSFMQRVSKALKGEVELYNAYLSGEVYWYRVMDEHNRIVNSCGGYYGKQGIDTIVKEAGFDESREECITYLNPLSD